MRAVDGSDALISQEYPVLGPESQVSISERKAE